MGCKKTFFFFNHITWEYTNDVFTINNDLNVKIKMICCNYFIYISMKYLQNNKEVCPKIKIYNFNYKLLYKMAKIKSTKKWIVRIYKVITKAKTEWL